MNLRYGDKIVKITTTFLFFIEGVIAIIASVSKAHMEHYHILVFAAVWLAITIALILIGTEQEKQIRTFVFIGVFATSFLSAYLAYLFENPYIFVVFQFVLWLCNVQGLRKYVFMAIAIINIALITLFAIAFKAFGVLEYISIVIAFLFGLWATFVFANRTENLIRMITEQNQSYDDMIALIESRFIEEQGANNAKSAFLANMSHEIRTPINAILGLNTMTLRESTEIPIKEYAKEIEGAGQTLLALVNDILDLSKVESGKMEIVPVEYGFAGMIKDVVNMVSLKSKAKQLELKVECNENIPSKLYGDDVRIRQVLVNLLNNAVKYTEKGSVTLSASCEVTNDIATFKYTIADTGIGIRKEDMERLFSKFERLDTIRNRNVEGTGLGMAITKRLLSLMGSKLDVESVYGEGSSFSFYLLQSVIDSTPIGNLEEKLVNTNIKVEENRYIAPDARILVVDDNKTNLMVFTRLLRRLKTRVDEAESGQQALDIISENEYDIIFLDHMMPGMDGIETLRRMRENSVCPNINTPVIALTANAISGSREFYLSEGFDDYMSKPIDASKLEQLIYDLLPEEKIELI